MPILCLPPSGGAATSFATWIEHARPGLEVIGLSFPGRGIRLREPALESMETLLASMGEAIAPALVEDYCVLGSCLGGLVAYELVRWLARNGARLPVRLFISGCAAPSTEVGGFADLSDDELVEQLRAWGGTSDAALANREIVAMTLRPLRVDLRLLAGYRYTPEPKSEVPITACYGIADSTLTPQAVMAWQHCTTAGFTSHALAGAHFPDPALLLGVVREEIGIG